MPTVVVRHARGSYPVLIERGALARLQAVAAEHLGPRRLAMITDETVLALLAGWGVPELAALRLAIPPGEESKTRERWLALSDALLDAGFGRDSAVLAVGGGVVGDLAGFVAATYLRGIPHLGVPTTLLAMLDSSVGGKVGVDTPRGKNLIGAFHPPVAVVADPTVLVTLPERTFRAGLAEAVLDSRGFVAELAPLAHVPERGRQPTTRVEHGAAILRRDHVTLSGAGRGDRSRR